MPRVTIGATGIKTLATASSTVAEGLEGAKFRLPNRGWLVAVSIGSFGSVRQASIHAVVDLAVGSILIKLGEDWIQQLANPLEGGFSWTGRIPLGREHDNFVRFLLDNNTGADFSWKGTWVVEDE